MTYILHYTKPVCQIYKKDRLIVKELFILTFYGVDFTKIPVTQSCVSQLLDCI